MAEAQAKGADTVMTQGATQSNHCRQTAAFAAKLGMGCHLLLEDRTGYKDTDYNANGNVLLDWLHGATTETRPSGLDMHSEMLNVADTYRAEGKKFMLFPVAALTRPAHSVMSTVLSNSCHNRMIAALSSIISFMPLAVLVHKQA